MIFYLLTLFSITHPIFISSSKLWVYDDNLELKVKFFKDDLEDGLRNYHGFSISIDSYSKIEKNYRNIDDYVNNKLQFQINGERVFFSLKNIEIINDVIEIIFVNKFNNIINSIELANEILISIYDSQKNIFQADIYGEKFFHIFSSTETKKTLIIK